MDKEYDTAKIYLHWNVISRKLLHCDTFVDFSNTIWEIYQVVEVCKRLQGGSKQFPVYPATQLRLINVTTLLQVTEPLCY